MKSRLLLTSLLLVAFVHSASAQTEGPAQLGPRGGAALLTKGPLPDADAFTADGKPVKLRELCEGKYTVLSSGCLTCPEFHKTYGEIEAAQVDFKSKGVQFYYFYKSLRHPELNGYVQAQNIAERLLQLAEARKMLDTKVPWISDTIDDSMRTALGANSQSVYVISPEGEIVYASARIEREKLRDALTRMVGAAPTNTQVSELKLPVVKRAAQLVNQASDWGVERPEGLRILAITPAKPDQTYLVKLRAEADEALLKTGTGRLFLGFYPDPIHGAHWNNLAEPMRYQLTLPEGVVATPATATAKKGPGDSDTQPRQFWVDIKSEKPIGKLGLKLDYFGCTSSLCMALSQKYTIQIKEEDRGARTYGMNRGTRGGGQERPRNATPTGRQTGGGLQMQNIDTNKDGSVSYDEMKSFAKARRGEEINDERFKARFKGMDTDGNGSLSAEELSNAPRPGGRPTQ